MKTLLITIGFLISFNGFAQKYAAGLLKTGSALKNIEGQIIVSDSTVALTIDGQTTSLKITKRSGYTFHVTDGTHESRYVVSHSSGRVHGFTFDRHITYHPPHHTKLPVLIYYCAIKRD